MRLLMSVCTLGLAGLITAGCVFDEGTGPSGASVLDSSIAAASITDSLVGTWDEYDSDDQLAESSALTVTDTSFGERKGKAGYYTLYGQAGQVYFDFGDNSLENIYLYDYTLVVGDSITELYLLGDGSAAWTEPAKETAGGRIFRKR